MSTTNRPKSTQIAKKPGLSALFLIATSLFFLGDHLKSGRDRIIATAISSIFPTLWCFDCHLSSGLVVRLHLAEVRLYMGSVNANRSLRLSKSWF